MKRRNFLFGICAAAAITAAILSPALDRLRGFSIDALFWLRHQVTGPRWKPQDSPSVVIAIDEESFRTPPFTGIPQALWTRELGQTLGALVDVGAKQVVFDVIFPTSVDAFVPGFDRDFLRALRKAADQDRVILGKVQHQQLPIGPARGQSFAVHAQRNIRAVNFLTDPGEVIRRLPLYFDSDAGGDATRRETSLALEAASRALGVEAVASPTGGVSLAGRKIPGSDENAMLLNFDGRGGDVPSFSLVDIVRCVAEGKTEFLRAHFADKIVLLGAVVDVEDRKLTSRRFMTGREDAGYGARCVLPPRSDLVRDDLRRDSIPGVYVHATAINNLIRGDWLRPSAMSLQLGLVAAAALAAAAVGFGLTAVLAAMTVLFGAIGWIAVATVSFIFGLVLPLVEPILAAALVLALVQGYRVTVSDRDRRHLLRSLSLYLPRAVAERLARSGKLPELGGETREVSVMFSDLAGFTRIAEGMTPAQLVALMNLYLHAMTEVIESHGGIVDKYIGDAIVAIFGAPLDDPSHARHAAEAAIACTQRLSELNTQGAFAGRQLVQRIGLASGPALVGNIGGRRRFNYTVMGDTVNLAARLESANKVFATGILAPQSTVEAARAAGADLVWREVDRVRVVGRATPTSLFELVGAQDGRDADRGATLQRYAEALAAMRARDFAAAMRILDDVSDDPPAIKLRARIAVLADSCLPPDWEAVADLAEK